MATALEFTGMCDASASVMVGDSHMLVASDEDNVLRLYGLTGGDPVASFPWDDHLQLAHHSPEADLEAAVRVGDRVYWMASHGANRNGEPRPNRRRFFATDIGTSATGEVTLTPFGTPYRGLVEDLAAHPKLFGYDLLTLAKQPPKSPGGLNIEGLAATPEGRLLIGFRNPIPDGTALVVPLDNPDEMLADAEPARFGPPVWLDLGGLGIRSIDYAPTHGAYFIVAGPAGPDGDSHLYRWSGQVASPPVLLPFDFGDQHPEAVAAPPAPRHDLLVLSDDGTRKFGGVECKAVPPDQRRFRAVWVTP